MVGSSIGRAPAEACLLVVGAATRDIEPTDSRGWRLGGGVSYGALTAARLGLRVRALIGVDELTAQADELGLLLDAGVELALARLTRAPVMENRPIADGGRLQLVRQAGSSLQVSGLPDAWRSTPAVLLAPVANELGPGWATAFPRETLVALAWQGLLRRLAPGRPMSPLPLRRLALIDRADLALVSAEDARAGGAALRELLRRPGQQLVVTHGRHGGLHLVRRPDGLLARHLPLALAPTEVDATGAGDVFLAAWCAATAATGELAENVPWRSLYVAALAAALSVEATGMAGVPGQRSIRGRISRPSG